MKSKFQPIRFTAAGKVLWLALLLAIATASLAFPYRATAQEPAADEFQTQAGPYAITVTADPSQLSLGTVVFTVRLSGVETPGPITDARVVVNATHEVDGNRGWANAIHQVSSPGSYEATMQLDGPGVWRTSVDVSSPLGRVEVETPSVTVPESRKSKSGSLVFIGAFLAILLGTAYVIWSSRKALRAREARSSG